ncbi:50S ribosomal protein L35 [Candidatus Vidania fulgoroideorum]
MIKFKQNKSFYKRFIKTKNFLKLASNFRNHFLSKKCMKKKRKLKKKKYIRNVKSKKFISKQKT